MNVLVTGSDGFIGKNLIVHLNEMDGIEVSTLVRSDSNIDLVDKVAKADFIFHLAGVNRPKDPLDFTIGNTDLTKNICDAIKKKSSHAPSIFYSSSIQATADNDYGRSKLEAEKALEDLALNSNAKVFINRFHNVFGKWCKPNYNSVVATFCHNIANDIDININDKDTVLNLVYIDDLVRDCISILKNESSQANTGKATFLESSKVYNISLGELAQTISNFKTSRESLVTQKVGTSIVRALHATYLSYLPKDKFKYELVEHADARGVFVEMLKTEDSGQFSFFTARPGITRGGHYHHSKTEKFLVINGKALFRFRNIITDEYYEVETGSDKYEVVETIPGWTHDIKNISDSDLVVMLWANEIFDRENPDTYMAQI